ncbi:hypothetical protein KI387_019392, partial [Taxus chinensis]
MESFGRSFGFLFLFCWLCLCVSVGAAKGSTQAQFGRKSFPSDFVFGVASAAYQYEGAAQEDGRGPSIWDTFSHTSGKIADNSTGDVANDQYHRYKEDVKLLADWGVDSYRFSISWSRILPKGRGMVNKKGVAYYNNLIDELLKYGIQPFVTLYHWDLPQSLQDEYEGFLSDKILKDFTAYADTCFEAFGDRVKKWVTMNEPYSVSFFGYNTGTQAPGRCSNSVGNCTAGNSATEPYIVTHHLLLAHAAAVKLYRDKYQKMHKGSIGITLVADWFIPYNSLSLNDKKAAQRRLDFNFGWYMNPVINGEYPPVMRKQVGARLPHFTKEQSQQVKGSYDFMAVNYYTTSYAINDDSIPNPIPTSYSADIRVNITYYKNGVIIGTQGGSDWLHTYPRGIRALLNYIKTKYNNPPIYITENGIDELGSTPMKESLNDTWRVNYVSKHVLNTLLAIRDGCNVHGYFGWTFMDDFEWGYGYTSRFGFYFVDRTHNLTRYPKASVY